MKSARCGRLESLLALPAAAAPSRARVKALTALAGQRYWQGDGDRAWELYEEAVAVNRPLGGRASDRLGA